MKADPRVPQLPLTLSPQSRRLVDPFGRRLNYLRLAVTDRCNLRCLYCMPEQGVPFVPHNQILSFEENIRLIGLFFRMGINKLRITGGEPFVRKGVMEFIEEIKEAFTGISLHVTTNGVLLAEYLDRILTQGLNGINLSLDTLQPERFRLITRRKGFETLIRSLNILIDSGIALKINSVIQRGMNEDEIVDLAELARDHPLQVRFIEQMPFNGGPFDSTHPLTAQEILNVLRQTYPDLREASGGESTARLYSVPGFRGSLGIIGGYSRLFCGSCNRLRITASGMLKTCLYDQGVLNLKELLRSGVGDDEICQAVRQAVAHRARDGFEAEARTSNQAKHSMAVIGG